MLTPDGRTVAAAPWWAARRCRQASKLMYLLPHAPVPPSILRCLNTQVLKQDGRTVAAARMVGRESLPTARPGGQATTPALAWAGPQAAGLARQTNVFLCHIDVSRNSRRTAPGTLGRRPVRQRRRCRRRWLADQISRTETRR